MAIGISNVTSVNLSTITQIGNITEPMDFFIRVNDTVFEGYLFFVILFITFIILFFAFQARDKEYLINMMYSAAAVSILGFFLRVVQGTSITGETLSLITDSQMWVFPILTAVLAGINWATKER